jgi:hypothetical protein
LVTCQLPVASRQLSSAVEVCLTGTRLSYLAATNNEQLTTNIAYRSQIFHGFAENLTTFTVVGKHVEA